MKTLPVLALALLSMLSQASQAADTRLQALQTQWATIQYQQPPAQRESALARLAEQAANAVAAEPDSAELHIWHGIVVSTWAGAKGGLGALGLARDAKASFERALQLDPGALDGSAYTSLATLYYQVPGWPIGFGDDDKAEQLLRRALEINPRGIDANYFHGDFLQQGGRYAEARVALEKALAADDRPGRRIADAGRRAEVRKLLDEVTAKLQ